MQTLKFVSSCIILLLVAAFFLWSGYYAIFHEGPDERDQETRQDQAEELINSISTPKT